MPLIRSRLRFNALLCGLNWTIACRIIPLSYLLYRSDSLARRNVTEARGDCERLRLEVTANSLTVT